MSKDKVAQITIRDLNKMDKREVKEVVKWLRKKASDLEAGVAPGRPWLVIRREYARVFNYSLMK